MKYWDDIENRLNDLIKNGYCFLPSIKNILDTKKYNKIISNKTGDKTYSENCISHIELLDDFGFSEILTPKLFEMAKLYFDYSGLLSDQYHIVRNVFPNQVSESYRGHFDSHLFTLIIPLNIPQNNSFDNGQLAFFPKIRGVPNNEVLNLIQKIYFKKYNSADGFKKLSLKKKILHENFLNYQPLIFIGLTTFHGNLPISNCYRQTLLSHYFDPSPKWGIGNILRNIRNR